MSAEKTPGISAIDTTNFARQIVLDFEFAPVPKQRQRRGLRNEIIEVGAVKLDYHGNVMGEFSQFVQTEYTEGVAYPVRELTGISAVDTAMAGPLYVVIKRLSDWIGRYSAQVVCWSGADRRQLLTECQAKHIDPAAFPTDWADLQTFYTSIMDVGSHGCVSLSDAATWFGIEFDESTGHAHSALADARVTAKLLKQVMDGDYRVSPRAQEIRQRWGGMGERAQTRLSKKCPELGDLLLKLKAEGR
ncbi:3'-5' exonuclease [Collinsella aerofaciens]|uniref:3'-5' exonuclease n=1 Tax=Collinsella aerofaciens TaxID=74426 RepID=UPI0032190DFF